MLNLNKIKDIVFQDIEPLLHALDIDYEIYQDNIYSNCPIHEGSDNKRGFSISLDRQQWKCWTHHCDDKYKDIYGLVGGVLAKRKNRRISFKESLEFVCQIYNIDCDSVQQESEPAVESDMSKIKRIFTYHNKLQEISIPEIELGDISGYFISKRHFLESTLQHFCIRDCLDPDSPFYKRAVIPIHSPSGLLVGYMGRSTEDYILPKYIFSKGFKSANYLYNYHRAVNKAAEISCLFVTEGQGDVWRLYEAGVENAVSIFGSTVSIQQERQLLQSGITKLVVLTDNDQAGRESKIGIQRQFNRAFKIMFPSMGRYKDVGEMNVEFIKENILSQAKGCY